MKNFRRQKTGMLLIAIALLLTVAVGGTIAYLAASAGPVTNTFIPGNVPPEVVEEFDGSVKKNVAIKNGGNVDAYIRAKVIFTWQDASGNVYSQLPVAGTDYEIVWGSSGWDMDTSDGFYYYTTAVVAGGQTSNLIVSCTPKNTAPANYTLHVEVLAQSIQADGTMKDADGNEIPAVVNAWGVTMDQNGKISK